MDLEREENKLIVYDLENSLKSLEIKLSNEQQSKETVLKDLLTAKTVSCIIFINFLKI